jgi:replicative DNA helicase
MLLDLRESGSLEEDADIVVFLYRDEVYNKELDNPRKGLAEVIVDKNRNGPVGTALMHFHKSYARFDEMAPENYQGFY